MKGPISFVAAFVVVSAATAQSVVGMTERIAVPVNAKPSGAAGDISLSANGRFLAFVSNARNLGGPDSGGIAQVFVRDRILGETSLASLAPGNKAANGPSTQCSISADGRYVAFTAEASNLVPGAPAVSQIYVHDRNTKVTKLVSVGGNQASKDCTITPDGRFVAFASMADNLVANDTNGANDVFVAEVATGNLVRASVVTAGLQTPFGAGDYSISGDGRYVAFENKVAVLSLLPPLENIWIRDLSSGQSEPLQTPGRNTASPKLSGDGRYLAYQSWDALADESSQMLYLLDRTAGTTTTIGMSPDGVVANGPCTDAEISFDGSTVSFTSTASNLVVGDTNNAADAFVYDQRIPGIRRMSLTDPGAQADGASPLSSISKDGTFVGFSSKAPILTGLSDGVTQPFVRIRDVSFALASASVYGGASVSTTITIAKPAPAGGIKFNLSSSSAGAIVPKTVTVKAGKTSVTFDITTVRGTTNQTARITLSRGDPIVSRWLTITSVVIEP